MKRSIVILLAISLFAAVLLSGCELFGGGEPTAEEIHEGAMTAITALYEATAPMMQGSDQFPSGVTVDQTDFDMMAGGGTLIITLSDYSPADSDVILDGEITIVMDVPLDLSGVMEEVITGSVTLTGLPVEVFAINITLTVDIEDAPYWDTATWTGTITLDGYDADVDQVMTEFTAMLSALMPVG